MINEDFAPIDRQVLADRVANKIISMVLQGKIKPGDKLPPERELATMFKVGRPAVREAFQALRTLRIVDIRHGSGVYIGSLEPQMLTEPLQLLMSLAGRGIVELTVARKFLESGIASVAAKEITRQDLAMLEESISRQMENVDDPEVLFEEDVKFHGIIVVASHNRFLENLMLSITELLRASRRLTIRLPGVRAFMVQDHRDILSALEQHDSEKSRVAMEQHLARLEDLVRNLTSDGANPALAEQSGTVAAK